MSLSRKPNEPNRPHSWYVPFLAAGTGGALETMTLYWTDTIAKRLQQNRGKVLSWQKGMGVSQNLLQNSQSLNTVIFRDQATLNPFRKIISLYPGVGIGITYKVIQRGYKLGFQKKLQEYLEKNHQLNKNFAAATSGAMVGAGEIFLLPLDIMKVKFQTKKHADKALSFKQVWQKENPFKGTTMTVPRNVTGSFALFGTREFLKGYGVNSDIANIVSITASIIIPSPFDVIKTRMQASSVKVSPLEAIKITYTQEGLSAFYKGSIAKALTQGPKVIFCLGVVDRIEHKIPDLVEEFGKKASRFFGIAKNTPTQLSKSSHGLFKAVSEDKEKNEATAVGKSAHVLPPGIRRS